jgi:hypothetical protein
MNKEPEDRKPDDKVVEAAKPFVRKPIIVRLTAAHRHNGIAYVAGDEITVDKEAADFIITHNKGSRL